MHQISNNQRIAKNTLFLYIRMLVMIIISLVTSRIIIQSLGVEDFGIYDLIGGITAMLAFISNALIASIQRFLTYDLELSSNDQYQKTFSMSINCQIIIIILILVITETIGLWFFNNHLNIPLERVDVASYVYQLSIFSFILMIFRIPYNASIIAHEDMSFFAYITIVESVLKLSIAFAIKFTDYDRLLLYAILMALVPLIINYVYISFCKRKYSEKCIYKMIWDKSLFRKLFAFSSWSMVNGGANVTAQQGGNILINLFNGVTANAAYGIANQVGGIIYNFVSNFQIAFQPQIVKLYASNRQDDLHKLIFRSSLFSYYLLLIIAFPFAVEADVIINLWLGVVPEYVVIFCILILIYYLIDSIQAPLWMLIYSSGNIKWYTIWSASLTFLNIPLAYLFLTKGCSVYIILIIRAVINLICAVIRTYYVGYIFKFPSRKYLKSVIYRAICVTSILILFEYIYKLLEIDISSIGHISIIIAITIFLIYTIGITREDKVILKFYISSFINRFCRL